jgi:hypothetical protein
VTILKDRRASISIVNDNDFSYHCAKRIIEEDIFRASIHCTCQSNSVDAYEYLDDVEISKATYLAF